MEQTESPPPVTVEGDWGPAQTKTVKNKLELYFGSKKKSSGGDCRVEAEEEAPRAVVYFQCPEGELLLVFLLVIQFLIFKVSKKDSLKTFLQHIIIYVIQNYRPGSFTATHEVLWTVVHCSVNNYLKLIIYFIFTTTLFILSAYFESFR